MADLRQLIAESGIDRAEAVLLVADLLGTTKERVIAGDQLTISGSQVAKLRRQFSRRIVHEPLAYIIGKKAFYGRDFRVTPNVLIPRPDTEALVELAGKLDLPPAARLADIGCGSGCIGISLKLEHPDWQVTLSDISRSALRLARRNAAALKADVIFRRSDLLENHGKYTIYDIIIANLPYVDRDWQTAPELAYEPPEALFAANGGLELIRRLIQQAPHHLAPGGYLLLELAPSQRPQALTAARKQHFVELPQKDLPHILALRY